jgi:hypothetical protein
MAEPNIFDQFDRAPSQSTRENIFDQFDPVEEAAAHEEEQPGFLERSTTRLQEMGTSIVDAFGAEDEEYYDPEKISSDIAEAYGPATRSPAEQVQEAGSELISGVSSVLVDGGLTLVDNLIPEDWQESIADFSRSSWEYLNQSPIIREGVALAQDSLEAYEEWAKENPDYANRLEEIVNITAVARPKGTKPAGQAYDRKLAKERVTNRRKAVDKSLEPATPKGGDGELVLTPGRLGRYEYKPSKWERKRNNTVTQVKGYNPNKSSLHNRNELLLEAGRTKDTLTRYIVDKGNPEIDTAKLKETLTGVVDHLDTQTLLTGDAKQKALIIFQKAEELIDASDGTATGILQARRELDSWVRKQHKSVFDADLMNATSVANKAIRDSINDAVEKATGSSVRTLLDKQHHLLSASDVLYEKALKEANSNIGRLKQSVERAVGMKFPTTPLAAGATTVAGVALLGTYPLVGATLAGTGGAYGLIKMLRSNQSRQFLNELRSMADAYPILKPQVNAIIQLNEELPPAEEDDGSL